MTGRSPEELYVLAAESFIALARKVDDEDWARPVPCAPDWSARDLLGHVVGIVGDVLDGRMEGAPGPAWTAAQVARHTDADVDELLAGWEARLADMVRWIAETGAEWPPGDCHCHEHDLRHAVELPGNRDNVVVRETATRLLGRLDVPFPFEMEVDGHVVTNDHPELGRYPHEEVVLRGATSFEILRSRLGRRSRRQVADMRWSGPPERIQVVVDQWFLLGPSAIDIHE